MKNKLENLLGTLLIVIVVVTTLGMLQHAPQELTLDAISNTFLLYTGALLLTILSIQKVEGLPYGKI